MLAGVTHYRLFHGRGHPVRSGPHGASGQVYGSTTLGPSRRLIVFEPAEIPAATIADAEITSQVDDRIRTTLGANNLLDKLPNKLSYDPTKPFDPEKSHSDQHWAIDCPLESPYGLLGRVMYIRVDVIGP